jgi:hypothetical protein
MGRSQAAIARPNRYRCTTCNRTICSSRDSSHAIKITLINRDQKRTAARAQKRFARRHCCRVSIGSTSGQGISLAPQLSCGGDICVNTRFYGKRRAKFSKINTGPLKNGEPPGSIVPARRRRAGPRSLRLDSAAAAPARPGRYLGGERTFATLVERRRRAAVGSSALFFERIPCGFVSLCL